MRSAANRVATREPLGEGLRSAANDLLAIGHKPADAHLALLNLDEKSQKLFRDFQSNLLSLISHELRTPLMGILNALSLLEAPGAASDFSHEELISMARRNAQRLHQTLISLLDLAAIESGSFHAQLKEVDVARLAASRIQAHQAMFRDADLRTDIEQVGEASAVPLLADAQKLGRGVDLALQSLAGRCEPGSGIKIRLHPRKIDFTGRLSPGREKIWAQVWSQAQAGFQGGVVSPFSAFAGTLQSEEAFLTRTEEGLGSEFMLIHEIMRLHHGKLTEKLDGQTVTLSFEFPTLSPRQALEAILASRIARIEPGVTPGSVALALVRVPQGSHVDDFCKQVKEQLFRASDSAYPYEDQRVAILLEDCKPEDAPRLIARIEFSLGLGQGLEGSMKTGWISTPEDGLDAAELLDLAEKRLQN